MLKFCALLLLLTGCSTFDHVPACFSSSSQLALNDCAAGQFEIADKKLSGLNTKYIARLAGAQKAAFIGSSAAWENYREAACKYEASTIEGGSAWPMPYFSCKSSLTNERITYMSSLSTCKEGDYNCPVW